MSDDKKKKPRKFKKPAAWLIYPAAFFISIYYRIKYGYSVDKNVPKIKGPALVLANHLSDKDHYLTTLALMPERPTFVLSAHFMMKKALRPVLGFMHVITKRMFDADAGAVLNIMRAARSGNVIVLFPEGRLTWYAHSMRVTEGTADLIRKLKINVYLLTPNGAALTFPKWAKKSRRGKITVTGKMLFSADEIPSLSKDEIYLRLADAIRHDDEKSCAGIRYLSSDTTLGLDGILYKCPVCGSEWTLTAERSHISCSCGLNAKLRDDYIFENAPFKTVNEWYEWQYSTLDTSVSLESEAVVSTTDNDGIMIDAGYGKCRLDKENFSFDGEIFGEKTSFVIPTSEIPAVPITVSKRFDVYHEKRLYNFSLRPDPRHTVKWAIYFDRLTDERTGLAGK